jgi:TP901 family phage tail tape measure protein
MAIILPIVAAWDNKGLNKAIRDIQRAEGGFKKFVTGTDAIGTSMKNAGKSLSMNVTAPLALIGASAVRTAADFEVSMASIKVNAGATGTQMDSLRELALKMGADTVFSAGEAADAILELSKGGLKPAEIQAGALKSAMALAATEGLGLAEASTIVIQTMNTFGLEASDTARAVDVLAAGAVASTAGVVDLADGMKYVGSTASTLGVDISETVTALAAMNNAGIDSTTAGTSLNRMMLGLIPTTRKAAKEAAALGLEFLNQDGSLKPMNEIVKELTDTYGGMGDAAKIASLKTVFGVEGMRAANTLIALGVDGYTELETAVNKQGIAQDLSNARMSGTAGALEQMKGSIDTAAIAIGDSLAPVVKDIAGLIQQWADKFSKLSPETKDLIVRIASIIAVAGPLLIIVGSVIGALGNLAVAIKTVGLVMQFLAMNPIGAVILGIAALIALIVIIVKNWDDIKVAASNAWARIKEIVGSAKDFIVSKMKAIGDFIVKYHPLAILFRLAQEWLPKIKERFGQIGSDLVAGIRQGIDNAWNSFKTFFIDKIGNPIKWAKQVLGIASPSKAFAEIGKNVVKGFENGVKTLDAKKITDKFKKVTGKINQALANDLDKAKNKLREAQESLKNYSKQVADSLRSGFSFSGALTASTESGGKKTFIQSLRDQAKEVSAYAKKIQQLIKMGLSESALNEVLSAGQEAGTKIADELIAGGSGAISETNKLTKSVESLATKVGKIAGKQFYQQGVDDGKAYVDGVKKAMAEAKIFQTKFAQKLVQDTLTGYKKSGGVLTKKEKQSVIDLAKGLGVDIPKMAKGGIVTSPTLALIGEAGPEAVVPLSGRNSPMGNVYNINVNAGIGTNGAQVGRDIVDAIKKYERASGPVFASA